jgi:transposase
MFDVNDDAKGGFRRIEILTGPGRRRRWFPEEKARIVAETLEAGARVADVARRWQLCPQQVFGWRREARHDGSVGCVMPASPAKVEFVPIIAEAPPPELPSRTAAVVAPVIEVELAGAVVRVSGIDDGAHLTAVLRAIRASASRGGGADVTERLSPAILVASPKCHGPARALNAVAAAESSTVKPVKPAAYMFMLPTRSRNASRRSMPSYVGWRSL